MKIVFVTATLTSGGSERVISLLANELTKRGHNVSIVLLRDPIIFYPLSDKIEVVCAKNYSNNMVGKLLWLRKYVKQFYPDVVIPFMTAVYCTTILALLGTKYPVISSERIDPRHSSKLRKILRWLLLRFTTHLVVQTQDIKSFYSKAIQDKTTIIANPVSEGVFSDATHIHKERRIISVGRLYDQKNQTLMINAFADIANKYKDYKLVIFGEGPLRNSLTEHIANLSLQDRVLLPGRNDNIIEELRKSEIFCLSSDYEGMSNALIEAVCVGLPIVTTRVSGVDDILEDGVNALIVPIKSRDRLSDALDNILGNDNLRNTFTANNLQLASKFKLDSLVTEWEELIVKVITRRKK